MTGAGEPTPPAATGSGPSPGHAGGEGPTAPAAPARRRAAARGMRWWAALWIAAALLALPASVGLFWLARASGAAAPLCGDRPGRHYPACQLPAPWGSGAPPTTTAFTP